MSFIEVPKPQQEFEKIAMSYAQVTCFTKLINIILAGDDQLVDYLPIQCDPQSLFEAFDNGVLLCKLVNIIDPDQIDLRVISTDKDMSKF